MKWRWLRTCLGGDPHPTRVELRKMESKLITMIDRPASSCGLHVGYLVSAFQAVADDWSTQDVLEQIVKPQTASWRCRYVDVINTEFVGEATFFVSHNLQVRSLHLPAWLSLREDFAASAAARLLLLRLRRPAAVITSCVPRVLRRTAPRERKQGREKGWLVAGW